MIRLFQPFQRSLSRHSGSRWRSRRCPVASLSGIPRAPQSTGVQIALVLAVLALLAVLAVPLLPGLAGAQTSGAAPGEGAAPVAAASQKYAGTYRIDGWHALEARGLHHFFYLHPNGQFLLAGEWPDNERSRFVGTWSVTGDRLYLNGHGAVDTNQGAWRTDYARVFRIVVGGEGFELKPEPAKNRFGLMGWPNAYRFFRRQPVPNLPTIKLPETVEGMAQYIATLMQRG